MATLNTLEWPHNAPQAGHSALVPKDLVDNFSVTTPSSQTLPKKVLVFYVG